MTKHPVSNSLSSGMGVGKLVYFIYLFTYLGAQGPDSWHVESLIGMWDQFASWGGSDSGPLWECSLSQWTTKVPSLVCFDTPS